MRSSERESHAAMCVLRLFRQSRLFTDDKVESAHCGTRLSNSRPPGVSERRRVRGIEKHRGCEVLNTTKLREYSRIQGVDTKYAYVGDIWMPINLIQSSRHRVKRPPWRGDMTCDQLRILYVENALRTGQICQTRRRRRQVLSLKGFYRLCKPLYP